MAGLMPFMAAQAMLNSGEAGDYSNVRTLQRPAAARYWRVVVRHHTSSGAYIREAEFRSTAGGADLTTPAMTVISNFTFNPPANIFDNNSSTGSFGGTLTHFGVDFGAGNEQVVEEIAITNFGSGQDFISGWAESSDNGTDWTFQWTLSKAPAATGAVTNVFRYDEYADGLIFDVRMNADPPVEAISGEVFIKEGSPVINTTSKYASTSVFNTMRVPLTGVFANTRFAGIRDWTMEFHSDDATAFETPFFTTGASPQLYTFEATPVLGLYTNNVTRAIVTSAGMLDGAEHHFAIVLRNGVPKVYRDGVSVALATANNAPWRPSMSGLARIGGESNTGRVYVGKIGRILFWNFARYIGDFPPPAVTDLPLYEP